MFISRLGQGVRRTQGTVSYTYDVASFVYGPFGRRAAKTINGATTQFLYDRLNPVQELDGASPTNVTANLMTGLKIDEYFSRTDSAGPATLLADALGSTLGLTDAGAIRDGRRGDLIRVYARSSRF
ncbi:MAG: hypothetical protein ABSD31_20475 [Candidatus Binataceae bacterium]